MKTWLTKVKPDEKNYLSIFLWCLWTAHTLMSLPQYFTPWYGRHVFHLSCHIVSDDIQETWTVSVSDGAYTKDNIWISRDFPTSYHVQFEYFEFFATIHVRRGPFSLFWCTASKIIQDTVTFFLWVTVRTQRVIYDCHVHYGADMQLTLKIFESV